MSGTFCIPLRRPCYKDVTQPSEHLIPSMYMVYYFCKHFTVAIHEPWRFSGVPMNYEKVIRRNLQSARYWNPIFHKVSILQGWILCISFSKHRHTYHLHRFIIINISSFFFFLTLILNLEECENSLRWIEVTKLGRLRHRVRDETDKI